jgi:BON domain
MRNESQDRMWSEPDDDARGWGTNADQGNPEYGDPRAADPRWAARGGAPEQRYSHLGSRDWRGQWAGDDQELGQGSDVPGYAWHDSGAAVTTGRDFTGGGRPISEDARYARRGDDPRRRRMGPPPRPGDDPRRAAYPPDPRGMPPQRFGDGRYGQPDEWSSRQSQWPNRPSRYEDANSGYGTGMGAGMYWSGESAREDDEMRGHLPTGRQIPGRGRLAQAGGPYAGRGPKGYHRSDQRIAEDVSQALTDDEYLDASDMAVTVQDGAVVLEGAVESRHARRLAEEIADSCPGVVDVINRLEIRDRQRRATSNQDAPTAQAATAATAQAASSTAAGQSTTAESTATQPTPSDTSTEG